MSTKRYKDGDRLHAGVFNKLLNDVENLEYDVDELKKKKDNNTWRPIKVNNKDVLGKEITTPLNLLPGDGVTIEYDNNGNVTITSTGGGGGGTSYVAGDNIEINGNVISAVDTTYAASDFDIKDLSDTTGLRGAWSGKQDALTAGDNIEIDSAGTISVTGITSATEQALEEMSLAISSNINELDGRLISVENGKQDTIDDLDIIRNGATLGATALQSFTETDPTVPDWAKTPNKPTYTAQEVGALPSSTTIPTKTSDLTNDSGYITGYTLPIASTSGLGGVKIGNGLEIDGTGVVNVVGKQDVLTAGNNIEITSAGTISATNTTYVASDFDVKDLADTTGLREEWSNKQNPIYVSVDDVINFLDDSAI